MKIGKLIPNLYSISEKKYLAILLLCQLGFFLTGMFSILLIVIKIDDLIDIPYSTIHLSLCIFYAIFALWIGLFWEAFSQTMFSVSASTKFFSSSGLLYPYLSYACSEHMRLMLC